MGVFVGLLALAPVQQESSTSSIESDQSVQTSRKQPFRYIPDEATYTLDFDPRKVRIGILEGWDREPEAFLDTSAMAYFSGPMYERHVDNSGQEITVPLGDLKLGQRVWRGRNRTASRQRAYIGIRHDGTTSFSFGELTPKRAQEYDTFIGGLHSIYNDLEPPPSSYKGAYSISMGQRIRYYLPRIRMVIGQRADGRIEVIMSRDGLTLEQTRELARNRQFLAAYMPDHASKSRFIIPGVKGFTEEDANWISGGATSFVHVPYMLRLSKRIMPLKGELIASLKPNFSTNFQCDGFLSCTQTFGGKILDRSLAGLNRFMEKGVEPVARMIWAPSTPKINNINKSNHKEAKNIDRSPLREPPITADPIVLRNAPVNELHSEKKNESHHEQFHPNPDISLPPDLPPPLVLRQGEALPLNPEKVPKREPLQNLPINEEVQEEDIVGAPPPPLLPEPPPPPKPIQKSDESSMMFSEDIKMEQTQ